MRNSLFKVISCIVAIANITILIFLSITVVNVLIKYIILEKFHFAMFIVGVIINLIYIICLVV